MAGDGLRRRSTGFGDSTFFGTGVIMLPCAEEVAVGQEAIAYVDESVRMVADPPAYLMAATILGDRGQLAPFEALLPRGARKLHWRDMTDRLRRRSVEAIAATEHLATVVVATPLNPRRQTRARTKCQERLLPALEELGVSVAVIEGMNNAAADARDVEAAERMRSIGTISSIRVEHAGTEEHGLWLPDQMLGAYGDALCGARIFFLGGGVGAGARLRGRD